VRVIRARPIVTTGVVFLASLAAAAGVGLTAAGREGSEPAETAAPADEAPTPPPAAPEASIHPDAVSTFLTRTYKIKPKKLWAGLQATLATSGYPPEEVDATRFAVKTSFVDFEGKNFPENVGEHPPEFSPDYPILQLFKVNEGKVSLEAIVTPADHGSTLSLRARILVFGLNRRLRTRVLTDRRSSGVIEKAFLEKLEKSLGVRPI